MGDFNSVMSNEFDRLQPSPPTPTGLSHWASSFQLVYLWRHFHPSDAQSTCLSTTYRTLSRIDMAFASPKLLREVASTEILSLGISNHAPFMATVRATPSGGQRIWRLSKYWIMYPEIQEGMPEALSNFWLSNVDSSGPLILWDAFKAWLRGEYIKKNHS